MVAVLVVVVCLLAGLAGAGYSSSPALCAAVYRPATTGYCIVAATTRPLPSPAAEAASRAAYSPASSLSFSQYNYLIITLQDWTVCLEKYRGASDVIVEISRLRLSKSPGCRRHQKCEIIPTILGTGDTHGDNTLHSTPATSNCVSVLPFSSSVMVMLPDGFVCRRTFSRLYNNGFITFCWCLIIKFLP